MDTARIKKGDFVLIDMRGVRFFARYDRKGGGQRHYFFPLEARYTWRECTSRHIVGWWKKMGGSE